MSSPIIISDFESEKLKPLLASLAKRNKSLCSQYSKELNNNIWAINIGNYSDNFLSTLCLICGDIIKSKENNLIIIDHANNVRYHGLCHLKDKGLHIFL